MLKDKVANPSLRKRIMPADEAASFIKNGMNVAMGGYTSCGYPKVISSELVARKKRGEELAIHLLTGSMVGPEIHEALGEAGVLSRFAPLITSKILAGQANAGEAHYVEQPMNRLPRLLRGRAFGSLDVAVVEAVAVTREGYIVPSNSGGMIPNFLEAAKQVIVEVNTAQPEELYGLHDIYLSEPPPAAKPIPILSAGHRIGKPYALVDPRKIAAIVASEIPDYVPESRGTVAMPEITGHLLNFLELESRRTMGGRLVPIQTGFGNLTNAILGAFGESNFRELEFFCGGVVAEHLALMMAGKTRTISTGSLQMGKYTIELLRKHPEIFREQVVIRSTDVANNGEVVARLGLIALNSGIEIDIYGNVNASHIMGSRVVNGLGGGANFAQNAGLSIVMLPSVSKNGDISAVVPMVSHHDIIEHDVDVVITENGVADLRGLDETERARSVIANCAHPEYRDRLARYLDTAILRYGGHHPIILEEALSWHQRLRDTGSMR
ncbi:acetyl-CoA hydrolase [Deltaproteobacteria bacterium]|nr:acetyl-CoA hydrolase [Deltaproteobacteria bacterium]